MAETSLINRIAVHAAAETALPTLPAKRANIAKSAWTTATFVTLGSIMRGEGGDNADINDDSVEATTERVVEEIFQTRGLQREEINLLKNRIDTISIRCEDASAALFALASDITITSNVATFAKTLTYRTLAIEINGLFIDYYPKVAIFIENPTAGFGEGGKGMTTLVCMPVATTTVPAGWSRAWYQPV
jgi:hypothetical protein